MSASQSEGQGSSQEPEAGRQTHFEHMLLPKIMLATFISEIEIHSLTVLLNTLDNLLKFSKSQFSYT